MNSKEKENLKKLQFILNDAVDIADSLESALLDAEYERNRLVETLKEANNKSKGLIAVKDELEEIIGKLKSMNVTSFDSDIAVSISNLSYEVDEIILEELHKE